MAAKKQKTEAGSRQRPKNPAANGSHSATSANGGPPNSPEMGSPDEQRASSSSSPEPVPETEPREDPAARAERLKEEGNELFRQKKYSKAIDLYSEAIALQPSEPTYLTNRAAAYMAVKRFKAALTDCQRAASLQSGDPSPKTLIRLARCQLAVGASGPALSVLREVLDVEPENVAAKQLQAKVLELEAHLRNFEGARSRKDWPLAHLALNKCRETIDGEGGDVPSEWRCWRIELEIARGNWDEATTVANEALRLDSNSADVLALRGLAFFLTARLPAALQNAVSALRLDPDNLRAKKLRQRVKAVDRLKDEGNASFKASNWQDAIDKYSEALDIVGDDEEECNGGQMRATLLSNRATTSLKLDRFEDALVDIGTSLDLNPTSFKALRTRARIHLSLEHYEKSVADFKSAIEHASTGGAQADVRALRTELHKAEVDLKRSKIKDYYKILGIPKDASEADIKKAYRRESLKHHPDKGGDEEKFKLASEAHAVLSDPGQRKRYDMGEDISGGMADVFEMNPDVANFFMFSAAPGGFSPGPSFGGMPGGSSFHFRSGGPGHPTFGF